MRIKATAIGTALAALAVLCAVFASSASAAPAWKFEAKSLEGSEVIMGGALSSSLTIPGLTTTCENFLYKLSIKNEAGTGKGEVTELPLYNCTTNAEACAVEKIGAEKLPWPSHLATFSSSPYIIIEGVRVGIVYSGEECAVGGISGRRHRLRRRADQQHDGNRDVQQHHDDRDGDRAESPLGQSRMERRLPHGSVPVASRTGDKRLIVTPAAKSTSAGLCLALVLAGLLLGGCGGGSSDPPSSATTESSAQVAGPSGAAGSSGGGGHSSQPGAGGKQQTTASEHPESRQDPAASTAGQGQKHGPRIARPKGQPEQAPTPAEKANLTVADMSLRSPSLPVGPGGPAPLTAPYTCDGAGKWPALSWSGVPAGTAELVLYAMNLAPVEGTTLRRLGRGRDRSRPTGIEAAKPCPRAWWWGRNSFGKRGYEICPEGSETYVFAVYALPRALSPGPGFDAREFRKALLGVSGNVGLLSVAYTRD